MSKEVAIALIISSLLNLLFLCLGIIWLLRKGNLPYLSNIFKRAGKNDYPAYYIHKKSQFEKLPITNSDIIFLGDSLTDEGEWSELFGVPIKNRGISGDTTDRILNRLDQIIESKPHKIFLTIGINDLLYNSSSEEVILKYQSILKKLQLTPSTKVFITSILPVNNTFARYLQNNHKIADINFKLKKLAADFNYEFIDVFTHLIDTNHQLGAQYTSDGLHLNGQGYLIWKKVVAKYVVTPE
ncbi:MAG: G-D-S-L family lipolytic protein [Nostocaceae cyanobacterium]|nr:G-D-S-L family lipolytic protein [Nostocaceae cyanobacterium]